MNEILQHKKYVELDYKNTQQIGAFVTQNVQNSSKTPAYKL